MTFDKTQCIRCPAQRECVVRDAFDYIETALALNETEAAQSLGALCHDIRAHGLSQAQTREKLQAIFQLIAHDRKAGRKALLTVCPDCNEAGFLKIEQAILWIDALDRTNTISVGANFGGTR